MFPQKYFRFSRLEIFRVQRKLNPFFLCCTSYDEKDKKYDTHEVHNFFPELDLVEKQKIPIKYQIVKKV